MNTYHIYIKGRVQGVGFRPFVYQLALKYGLKGWVNNSTDGVHIEVNGPSETVRAFYQTIIATPPRLSIIQSHSLKDIPSKNFDSFCIKESQASEKTDMLLTPDFAMCDDCKKELYEAGNRRQYYPFITCTNCGPRYSIINDLPYDRPNTTMQEFEMCPACNNEYNNPEDRRHFSQTNSCPECAVTLSLFDREENLVTTDTGQIISLATQALENGEILAIKGIGGYLLMVDAKNENAVLTLRERKQRPFKPFAIMYPSLETLERDVSLTGVMKQHLQSPGSPIVLAPLKKDAMICRDAIAPENPYAGVMLPYAPLFELLLSTFKGPVVATSGNVHGSPIIYRDDEALDTLTLFADFMISNNREIVVPQDDSVIRFSERYEQPVLLRRSWGYAPSLVHDTFEDWQRPVLAVGGEMKNTFGIVHEGQTYISQYLGDMGEYDTQKSYRHTLDHLKKILDFKPEVILADKHPGYFTSELAHELAVDLDVPLIQVQHHEAHFAAVLAENNLLKTDEGILGVVWDGTGWGDHGNIWGGEFFSFSGGRITRCRHLQSFRHILGDKMSKEPRISALSLLCDNPDKEALLGQKFQQQEWQYYQRLLDRKAGIPTTSMGRLFDGVASLLSLKDFNTFEAEAAMALEFSGLRGSRLAHNNLTDPYRLQMGRTLPTNELINDIVQDINEDLDADLIAYRFHLALAHAIKKIAEVQQVRKVAFSGGVFQNTLLIDLVKELLPDYKLFFHRQLSPNDECISFGQLAHFYLQSQKKNVKRMHAHKEFALT